MNEWVFNEIPVTAATTTTNQRFKRRTDSQSRLSTVAVQEHNLAFHISRYFRLVIRQNKAKYTSKQKHINSHVYVEFWPTFCQTCCCSLRRSPCFHLDAVAYLRRFAVTDSRRVACIATHWTTTLLQAICLCLPLMCLNGMVGMELKYVSSQWRGEGGNGVVWVSCGDHQCWVPPAIVMVFLLWSFI